MRDARIATSDIECEVPEVRRVGIQRMIAGEDVAGGRGGHEGQCAEAGLRLRTGRLESFSDLAEVLEERFDAVLLMDLVYEFGLQTESVGEFFEVVHFGLGIDLDGREGGRVDGGFHT
jgi:hypothetical protein